MLAITVLTKLLHKYEGMVDPLIRHYNVRFLQN